MIAMGSPGTISSASAPLVEQQRGIGNMTPSDKLAEVLQ
jgi:hypothetical protein